MVATVSFAIFTNGQPQQEVNSESTSVIRHDGERHEPRDRHVVPDALIQQLSAKWHAEATAGTSSAQLSDSHRALLVDALSRVNWTPFCSYTEEAIVPDETDLRVRHHTFEFDDGTLEDLIERAAVSTTDFSGETDLDGSGGFETSLDEFAGMREDLTAAKVVDATDLTVIYELPVPNELLEGDASPEDMESRFMRKLMENLRVLFTVDTVNRGPKEVRVELLKPVRVFPGVKIKKVRFTTNFRYLDDVQEFVADRNASEMSIRAFLVAGFSENESKTLSDFRCVQKG